MDGARVAAAFLATYWALSGQTLPESSRPLRLGPGISPPRLLHKVEPKYSAEAQSNYIQGTVIYQLEVDENGRTTNISVLSPLGFGLDENGQAAIEQWQFAPGTKDGKPVKILAMIEVSFRFPSLRFDEKVERQRSSYNVALAGLKQGGKAKDRGVETIQGLARSQYPAAMYMVGMWEFTGENGAKDPVEGLTLLRKSANKNYAPAMFEIALRTMDGRDGPANMEQGLDLMRKAAVLGSAQAQFQLGTRYEKGNDVPLDANRARRYYRLCATKGAADCQYRLANLLLAATGREHDTVQAIAWLQLAADQGNADAKSLLEQEAANLTPEEKAWVAKLKPVLLQH